MSSQINLSKFNCQKNHFTNFIFKDSFTLKFDVNYDGIIKLWINFLIYISNLVELNLIILFGKYLVGNMGHRQWFLA